MRYFIQLSYLGTNYHGWQIQPNAISVQEVLEKTFSLLLKKHTQIVGAGRTDTGVHASYYIAHFESEKENLNQQKFLYSINSSLPYDISVQKIVSVAPDLHARFSALSRTYEYRIHLNKNPFLENLSTRIYGEIDFLLMNEAAQQLFNYTDFTSFSKSKTNTATNNCKVMLAQWTNTENEYIFTIKADRFLRNMVRAITGTLLDVGRKKLNKDDFCNIITSKNRSLAGTSVPAKGLYLKNIKYPVIF